MKRCTKCEDWKVLDEFCLRNNSRDGLTGQCKDCLNVKHQKHRDGNREGVRESSREWAKRNQERNVKAAKKWRKKNPFTVALQQSRSAAKKRGYYPCDATVEELMEAYTGRCDICGVPSEEYTKRLQMDHDHNREVSNFRGFLCGKCNRMLGLADDSVDILEGASHYLMSKQKTT